MIKSENGPEAKRMFKAAATVWLRSELKKEMPTTQH